MEKRLNGRKDKRHTIVLVVELAPMEGGPERRERTYTDNISAGGFRIRSMRPWRSGEQVEIRPLKEDAPECGEVVYCQKRGHDRFFVGIKLRQGPIPWSVLQRFGIAITAILLAIRN